MLYMITKDGMFVPIRNQGDDYFYDIKFKLFIGAPDLGRLRNLTSSPRSSHRPGRLGRPRPKSPRVSR